MRQSSFANRFERTIGWAAIFWVFSTIPLQAQTVKGEEQGSGEGNSIRRFLRTFDVPAIRSFESREEFPQSAIKDGRLQLSEADAVRLALENNLEVITERYTPYFNLWEATKARAVLNPSVSFRSYVDRSVRPAWSILQGADTLLNLNTVNELIIRKPFENGLDVDFNFSVERLRTSSIFYSVNPALTSNVGITFTKHLLKDSGRIGRSRFLRVARNNLSISQEEFTVRISDIVADVLKLYWDLVLRVEEMKLRETSKTLAQLILEQNKAQLEVGTMTRLEVLHAEAEFASRNEELVSAGYNRRLTEDQLKKLLSSRLDSGATAEPVDPLSTSDALKATSGEVDVTQAIQRALELRPEVKLLMFEMANKQIQVDYTRNQLRPSLDLVAGYSQNGLGGPRTIRDFSQSLLNAPIIGFERGGLWDSLDSLFSRKYIGYNMGFTFRVPVGNDEARANSAQAQIAYKQSESRLHAQRQKIALEVREAYQRMAMARARVAAAEVTVAYAVKRLQAEQDKRASEVTTTRSVLEAQKDLTEAQARLLIAHIDGVKSRIDIQKATGEILAAHKVEVKDANLTTETRR